MTRRTAHLLLILPLVAIFQLNRASGTDHIAAKADITIDNFTFSPAIVTVKAGTRITWTNHDDIPHTVFNDYGQFRSRVLDTDDTFSFTPQRPGTYTYFCTIHPKMTAKIVVE
jgi:plastocyanin